MPLFVAFAACGLAALLASSAVLPAALYFVLKPLTQGLVIAHAWRRGAPAAGGRTALLAGLLLSLVGDIALLWPQQGFLPGLVAFLLAHLAYLFAFTRGTRFLANAAPFVGYALVAGSVLAWLWPGVPAGLRLPVLLYVACLAAMAAQAAVQWLRRRGTADEALARCAAIGGLLFVASDSLLATNRFGHPLPAASWWILLTYWSAQWLIASSLPPPVKSAPAALQAGPPGGASPPGKPGSD